jgi:redox-sensitive bicupin YhaK (pirin superfamily)
VQPGMGFGSHPHRDMEILTYMLEGRLAHQDSLGNRREISAGQLQVMSAGSGVMHSEFNASRAEAAHFLQIWIRPNVKGIPPRYAEWNPPSEGAQGITLLASADGREGSIEIAQDARVYLVKLAAGEAVEHLLAPGRAAWVQVMRGSVVVNGERLGPGDGAAIENDARLAIAADGGSEALLFDLA